MEIVWLHHYKELAIADLLYTRAYSRVRRIIFSYDSSGDVSPVTYCITMVQGRC